MHQSMIVDASIIESVEFVRIVKFVEIDKFEKKIDVRGEVEGHPSDFHNM